MDAFTIFHVIISLIGIATGFVVVTGMLAGKTCPGWTAVFLATTGATSLTGFLFPFHGFTPAIGVGILSVLVVAVACFARYARDFRGAWRWIYVLNAVFAFYLNFFVLIVQSFLKVPALHTLAPKGTEPPFAVAQGIALVIFIGLAIAAARRFRPIPVAAA